MSLWSRVNPPGYICTRVEETCWKKTLKKSVFKHLRLTVFLQELWLYDNSMHVKPCYFCQYNGKNFKIWLCKVLFEELFEEESLCLNSQWNSKFVKFYLSNIQLLRKEEQRKKYTALVCVLLEISQRIIIYCFTQTFDIDKDNISLGLHPGVSFTVTNKAFIAESDNWQGHAKGTNQQLSTLHVLMTFDPAALDKTVP